MDIQGWLQGTADRAPPDPSDGHDAPAFLRSIRGNDSRKPTKYRRKRQRGDSDSSIIVPRHRGDDRNRPGSRPENIGKRQRATRRLSRSETEPQEVSSRASSVDGAIIRQPDSNPYQKRARHKTKVDTYELKRGKGKGKQQRNAIDDVRPDPRRDHRSRRNGDGKRTEDLVQGFKLKAKSKKGRLTVSFQSKQQLDPANTRSS